MYAESAFLPAAAQTVKGGATSPPFVVVCLYLLSTGVHGQVNTLGRMIVFLRVYVGKHNSTLLAANPAGQYCGTEAADSTGDFDSSKALVGFFRACLRVC